MAVTQETGIRPLLRAIMALINYGNSYDNGFSGHRNERSIRSFLALAARVRN